MARASNIYLIFDFTLDDYVGAFTVKKEAMEYMSENRALFRMRDGELSTMIQLEAEYE